MLYKLTKRQYSILCFIVRLFKEKTQYPTIRQIGDEFGIASTNGVRDHLVALEKKGWVVSEYHNKRGVYMTREARAEFGLLFEYEFRELSKSELDQRLKRPVPNGTQYWPVVLAEQQKGER